MSGTGNSSLSAKQPVSDKQPVSAEQPPLADQSHAARGSGVQRPILVALDDDPTGTQTVHGVPVLTTWAVDELAAEMSLSPVFFVLTNSRGLNRERAVALADEIGTNLREASIIAGVELEVVSRGDSTLRGHYPHEVDALAQALGWDQASTSIVPYFGPGGRITKDDTHFVGFPAEGGGTDYVPVGETEFAADTTFGFTSSNLCEWVGEKTEGRVAADDVVSLSLDLLRNETAEAVAGVLEAAGIGATVVVNATADDDIAAFSEALDALNVWESQAGSARSRTRWIHRTAASFVAIRAALEPRALLNANDLAPEQDLDGDEGDSKRASGGLVVVGSHVAKTTAQLKHALNVDGVVGIELSVDKLLGGDGDHAADVGDEVNRQLALGADVVLYTSRSLKTASSAEASLELSRRVSVALCDIVRGLINRPQFLVAKGGITSSDVATEALGIKRAMVLGQIQAGVPVWAAGEESLFPGLSYIVYPGNVGSETGLADAIATCRGR